ncbi:MAG: hypothetical protein ACJAVA_002479, partial [Flavobacteriaceae bacterium]
MIQKKITLISIILVLCSCSDNKKTNSEKNNDTERSSLFSKVDYSQSNINFTNKIIQNKEMNFMNNLFIYSGAGVGVGDIDNDGLIDLYFTSNFGPNKLYKNEGDFTFK